MMIAQSLSPALAYLIAEWAIRLGALLFIPFRRTPDSARAWLLLLLFLPVPGLLLYLLIGRPTYPRRRRARLARAAELLQTAAEEIAHSRSCRQPVLSRNFRQAADLIERLGRFPALGSNNLNLLTDYEGVVSQLIADVDAAQHHVHILMYIFADDETGALVVSALERAAARGVACRVLVDAAGSRRWSRSLGKRFSAAGVAYAEALPIAPWRRRSARADLRNHRKIAVIDGVIGYVGSQNIVNAAWAKGVVNEELVVRSVGPAVVAMQAVFAVDWFLGTEEVLEGERFFPHFGGSGAVTAQLMPSGPDYGEAGVGYLTVALIHAARERVVITTPYFIPDAALLQALRTAVLRGVSVDLVVPYVSDQVLVRLAQQSYYTELLDAGVRVHRYRDRFLHAKLIGIDEDISLIGSSNVDVRSFVLNAEVTLIVYDPQVSASLRLEQQRYIRASDHLTSDSWEQRSSVVKLFANVARLVSPLL